MPLSPICQKLIEKNRAYHVSYQGRLSNHMSMALSALDHMGADEQSLQNCWSYNIGKLEPVPNEADVFIDDIKPYLGKRKSFLSLVNYFSQQVKKNGYENTIEKHIDILLPGIGCVAFHALIRLAYALQNKDEQEIIWSLSYWVYEYQDLAEPGEQTQASPVEMIKIASQLIQSHQFQPGNIQDRMAEVSEMQNFQSLAIQPKILKLKDIAKTVLAGYLATGNFTVLHAVTSTQAFRFLLPFCADENKALAYFWQAIVVAVMSMGGVDLTNLSSG